MSEVRCASDCAWPIRALCEVNGVVDVSANEASDGAWVGCLGSTACHFLWEIGTLLSDDAAGETEEDSSCVECL